MWLDGGAATVMRFRACSRFHESHEPIASITMTAAAISAMTDFSSALTERRLSMERIHFERGKTEPHYGPVDHVCIRPRVPYGRIFLPPTSDSRLCQPGTS